MNFHAQSGSPSSRPQCHYRRDLLPAAVLFYERELGNFRTRPRNGWVRTNCPFHKSKSGTSFSINLQSGAFHCFGCGAKGGTVLNFIMLRDGLDFKAAAQVLGCWNISETPTQRSDRSRREVQQRAEKARQKSDREAERQRRLTARAELLFLLAMERTAVERIAALQRGARPDSLDEMERCYEVAALLVDEIREADREYANEAGLECDQ
jgi:DNA primase